MTMSRDLGEHTGQVGVAEAEKPAPAARGGQ
jgi:hypothetical protein